MVISGACGRQLVRAAVCKLLPPVQPGFRGTFSMRMLISCCPPSPPPGRLQVLYMLSAPAGTQFSKTRSPKSTIRTSEEPPSPLHTAFPLRGSKPHLQEGSSSGQALQLPLPQGSRQWQPHLSLLVTPWQRGRDRWKMGAQLLWLPEPMN